jgi:hypothetical protein
LSTDVRAISDDANVLGKPDYPGFREHRHDQSIFSLLTKRYDLPAFRDPSQWGNELRHCYPTSEYGQIIEHTRKRSRSVLSQLKSDFERMSLRMIAERYGHAMALKQGTNRAI